MSEEKKLNDLCSPLTFRRIEADKNYREQVTQHVTDYAFLSAVFYLSYKFLLAEIYPVKTSILHVCAYIIYGGSYIAANFPLKIGNSEIIYYTYSNRYVIFFLIMTIASINLIRGVFKKSVPLIASWIILSSCMLSYIAQYLFDEFIYWISFGNIRTWDTILVWFLIFGIEILCIIRVFGFCKTLFIQDLQQKEFP